MIRQAVFDYGPGLLPQHEALLAVSAITPAVAAARGYRSITVKAEVRRYGFSEAQCQVPALLIPIWGVTGNITTYQLRPDQPRVVNGKALKYETPRGARVALDVPRGIKARLADPKIPLFVTEGARKADAAVTQDLCCIALLGVWNWRGTNEWGGKTALADWESVALQDRQVYITFDSDVMLKEAVNAALVRLKAFLETRGARVAVIYLPPGEGGVKVGLDDFFAARRTVGDLLANATETLRDASPTGENDTTGRVRDYAAREYGLVKVKIDNEGIESEFQLTNFTAAIIEDVSDDDGVEVRRRFLLDVVLNTRAMQISVPAPTFAAMHWPVEKLGAEAVVFPNALEEARTAIQLLSGAVPRRQVYTHLGWRRIEEAWAYLHAEGTIGPEGPLPGVEVTPPEALRRFRLPEPTDSAARATAVRASLDLLDVAPRHITLDRKSVV